MSLVDHSQSIIETTSMSTTTTQSSASIANHMLSSIASTATTTIDAFLGSLSYNSLQTLKTYCSNIKSSPETESSLHEHHLQSIHSYDSNSILSNPTLLCDRLFNNLANLTSSTIEFIDQSQSQSPLLSLDSIDHWSPSSSSSSSFSSSSSLLTDINGKHANSFDGNEQDDGESYLSPSKLLFGIVHHLCNLIYLCSLSSSSFRSTHFAHHCTQLYDHQYRDWQYSRLSFSNSCTQITTPIQLSFGKLILIIRFTQKNVQLNPYFFCHETNKFFFRHFVKRQYCHSIVCMSAITVILLFCNSIHKFAYFTVLRTSHSLQRRVFKNNYHT